jgi:hypothetical protein
MLAEVETTATAESKATTLPITEASNVVVVSTQIVAICADSICTWTEKRNTITKQCTNEGLHIKSHLFLQM